MKEDKRGYSVNVSLHLPDLFIILLSSPARALSGCFQWPMAHLPEAAVNLIFSAAISQECALANTTRAYLKFMILS